MAQGALPWQRILGLKLAKSDYTPLFVALKGYAISQSDFKSSHLWWPAYIVCKFDNFGLVTPKFTKVKDVGLHPVFLL